LLELRDPVLALARGGAEFVELGEIAVAEEAAFLGVGGGFIDDGLGEQIHEVGEFVQAREEGSRERIGISALFFLFLFVLEGDEDKEESGRDVRGESAGTLADCRAARSCLRAGFVRGRCGALANRAHCRRSA